jgi:hypothetical protein
VADIPKATVTHYRQMQRLQLLALAAARRAWGGVEARFISESWTEALAALLPVVTGVQLQAATAGATYAAATLAEQSTYVAPAEFTDPRAFAGVASDGRPLEGLLYSPATTAKHLIAGGATPMQALAGGRGALDTIVRTVTADAARQAAGVDIATRPAVGWVRMLNPPSCSRCTILAGRVYRWNDGFLRHPRCDCVHVATTTSLQAARDEGLVDDPYQVFAALSEADQDRTFGRANAQAIRDGADISQVVNARRGMTANGNFTTEGTSRRGAAAGGLRPGQRRMTPELIYRQAGDDRDRALELLREHGYLLPAGQVPGGALRGQAPGFGATGRGGTRRAASQAVLDANATGVRDPGSRYTMTAAERRLHDARARYEAALAGRDPYGNSQAFSNRPDPTGRLRAYGWSSASGRARPATPAVLARAEAEYRRLLATGGQIHTS